MRTMTIIALVLVIVGGLNWLLVGLFQYDLVAGLFGGQSGVFARLIYILVGLAAIWLIIRLPALADTPSTRVTTTSASTAPMHDPLRDRTGGPRT